MSKSKTVYRVGDCEVRQITGRNGGKFEVRQNGRLWSVHDVEILAENEASRKATVS